MDPVSIAFANAQRGRQDLDRTYAQQGQAFNQVMQAASTFSSIADRAASREQQQKQFDATMEMRKQEMDNRKELTGVELAIRKSMLENDNIKLQQAQKSIAEAPEKEAANAFFTNTMAEAIQKGLPPSQARQYVAEKVNGSPYSKFISPLNLMGMIAKVSDAAVDTQLGLAQAAYNQTQKMAMADVYKYSALMGEDPNRFTNPETGQFDIKGATQFISEARKWEDAQKLQQEEQSATNAGLKAKAEMGGRLSAMKEAGMSPSGKVITDENGNVIDETKPLTRTAALSASVAYERLAKDEQASPADRQTYKTKAKYYDDVANGRTPTPATEAPVMPPPASKGTVPQSKYPVK